MTTIRSHSLVSIAAGLALTLALGGCAGNPSRGALNDPALAVSRPLAIRFDNEARQYVHVYLVGENREWLLGRVEPGGRATLRIPEGAMANDTWSMRLAVLGGEPGARAAAAKPGAGLPISPPPRQLPPAKRAFPRT